MTTPEASVLGLAILAVRVVARGKCKSPSRSGLAMFVTFRSKAGEELVPNSMDSGAGLGDVVALEDGLTGVQEGADPDGGGDGSLPVAALAGAELGADVALAGAELDADVALAGAELGADAALAGVELDAGAALAGAELGGGVALAGAGDGDDDGGDVAGGDDDGGDDDGEDDDGEDGDVVTEEEEAVSEDDVVETETYSTLIDEVCV